MVGPDPRRVHCPGVRSQKYTPEYRREAANLVIESERPIAHVAKEIGVAPGLLGRWVKNERQRLRIL
ncbi:transposase [Corynebacterium accolens]|uniref:transposase n=1 Tax=Corynebacterium accolens TaxID=38284 RepID=UPI00266FC5F5|nr:transposase [Corynebacterium accolens]WKS59236.1 transposase [Corynebacterium accolens]